MKKLLGSLIFIFILVTVFVLAAPNIDKFSDSVRGLLSERIKEESTVESWRKGVKEEYNVDLVKLEFLLIPISISESTDNKILLIGTLIITGYCTKGDFQVRIVSECTYAWIISTGNIILNAIELNRKPNKIFDGWYGTAI